MSIFNLFGSKSARSSESARDRLQILFAQERASANQPDLVKILHREIMDLLAKHIDIPADAVLVKLNDDKEISSLEINIELPSGPINIRKDIAA